MHAKLKMLLACWVVLSSSVSAAAKLSLDTPLSKGDVASFTWPETTVQELTANDRTILVVCKSVGSGLVRRYCYVYYWNADTSVWLPVLAFHSSSSRVDATYSEGKIVLTSYGGKVLLELTVETLEPYYDPAELERPRVRGKADEETIERTKKR